MDTRWLVLLAAGVVTLTVAVLVGAIYAGGGRHALDRQRGHILRIAVLTVAMAAALVLLIAWLGPLLLAPAITGVAAAYNVWLALAPSRRTQMSPGRNAMHWGLAAALGFMCIGSVWLIFAGAEA